MAQALDRTTTNNLEQSRSSDSGAATAARESYTDAASSLFSRPQSNYDVFQGGSFNMGNISDLVGDHFSAASVMAQSQGMTGRAGDNTITDPRGGRGSSSGDTANPGRDRFDSHRNDDQGRSADRRDDNDRSDHRGHWDNSNFDHKPSPTGSATHEPAPAGGDTSGSKPAPAAGDTSGSQSAPAGGDTSGSKPAPTAGDTSGSQSAPAGGDTSGSKPAPTAGDTSGSQSAPAGVDTSGSKPAPAAGDTSGSQSAPAGVDTSGSKPAPAAGDTTGTSTSTGDSTVSTTPTAASSGNPNSTSFPESPSNPTLLSIAQKDGLTGGFGINPFAKTDVVTTQNFSGQDAIITDGSHSVQVAMPTGGFQPVQGDSDNPFSEVDTISGNAVNAWEFNPTSTATQDGMPVYKTARVTEVPLNANGSPPLMGGTFASGVDGADNPVTLANMQEAMANGNSALSQPLMVVIPTNLNIPGRASPNLPPDTAGIGNFPSLDGSNKGGTPGVNGLSEGARFYIAQGVQMPNNLSPQMQVIWNTLQNGPGGIDADSNSPGYPLFTLYTSPDAASLFSSTEMQQFSQEVLPSIQVSGP